MHESGWICIRLSQIIWSHIYSWTRLMDPLSIIMLLFFMGYYKPPNTADIEKWMQIAPKLNVPTGMCAYINIDKKYIRGVCVHVGAINRTTMPHYKRNQALYLCIQTHSDTRQPTRLCALDGLTQSQIAWCLLAASAMGRDNITSCTQVVSFIDETPWWTKVSKIQN